MFFIKNVVYLCFFSVFLQSCFFLRDYKYFSLIQMDFCNLYPVFFRCLKLPIADHETRWLYITFYLLFVVDKRL